MEGKYFEVAVSDVQTIDAVVVRDNGNEIAFDLAHRDGYMYTINLKRNNGTLFTGTAVSQPGGDMAQLTCRVFEDRTEGLTLIAGSKWESPGESNYLWQVTLDVAK